MEKAVESLLHPPPCRVLVRSWSPSWPIPSRWDGLLCLCTSLPFLFNPHPSCHYRFCCMKQMAVDLPQGDADESIPGKAGEGRKHGNDLLRKGGKKKWNSSGFHFISSYIIHLELHLGWCKSVPSHPPFWAFTLKRLCGWSVLRRFGPRSLPPPPVLINHYAAEPHLSSWWETSNEHRDQGSKQPQKYFIRSTFKHTSLCGWPHWWRAPYHVCMINSRPWIKDVMQDRLVGPAARCDALNSVFQPDSSSGRRCSPPEECLCCFLDGDDSFGAVWPLGSCFLYGGPSEERTGF